MPIAFLAEAAPPAILDEIQYAPDLLHYIKEDIDANRSPGRWLLTGSQHFALMHGLSQTLSGRVAVLTLDPLSTAEVEQQPAPSGIDALLDKVFGASSAADQPSQPINLTDWLLRGGALCGIEIKATATPSPNHAEGLARWRALVGSQARGVLACRVDAPHALRPGIRAVPWHLAW